MENGNNKNKMKLLKIALNKKYITKDGNIFAPVRNRMGENTGRSKNMLGMPTGRMTRGEMTFIDKDGKEYKRSELKKEYKEKKANQ